MSCMAYMEDMGIPTIHQSHLFDLSWEARSSTVRPSATTWSQTSLIVPAPVPYTSTQHTNKAPRVTGSAWGAHRLFVKLQSSNQQKASGRKCSRDFVYCKTLAKLSFCDSAETALITKINQGHPGYRMPQSLGNLNLVKAFLPQMNGAQPVLVLLGQFALTNPVL